MGRIHCQCANVYWPAQVAPAGNVRPSDLTKLAIECPGIYVARSWRRPPNRYRRQSANLSPSPGRRGKLEPEAHPNCAGSTFRSRMRTGRRRGPAQDPDHKQTCRWPGIQHGLEERRESETMRQMRARPGPSGYYLDRRRCTAGRCLYEIMSAVHTANPKVTKTKMAPWRA